jgi:serine/threonine protein phosphatase PrpC
VKLTYAQLSLTGPVRPQNEDCLGFWDSADENEQATRGAIAIVADGLGGHGNGEVASQLAVETAIRTFCEAAPATTDNQLLSRIFKAANLAVYDAGMHGGGMDRMATTLTVSLFRRKEIAVGHVGDSRSYLIRQHQISQLTSDHTYAAMQLKMSLISKAEAAASEMRNMLTRSIGHDPTVQVDYSRHVLRSGDVIVQCTDGLHGSIAEHEILDAVNRMRPSAACEHLTQLAEKRGSQDNISVQIVRVENVPRVGYYRGAVAYLATPAVPASADVQAGQVLDERFEILDVINRSAMSSVFKAIDLTTGRHVALKVPLPNLEGDPGAFARFQREEEIGRSLDHPSILKILPVDDKEKSRPYIVMELLEGQTLEQRMQQTRVFPEDEALRIVSHVCDALGYLHEHEIVHRDLKPQNIMLCNDGSIRIMDFGIAKAGASKRLTFGGFSPTMGTPDYMAPEQVKGHRGDERTDLYSLGAILYEMLTGHVPFEAPNAFAVMNARLVGDPPAPRTYNPVLRPQVEEIILHAMAREPADRYESAKAMKADLDHPDDVVVTGRVTRLTLPTPWKNRWRTVRIAVITALVPIVLFLLLWLMLSRR